MVQMHVSMVEDSSFPNSENRTFRLDPKPQKYFTQDITTNKSNINK